ncbi:MAG: DNRLRE domain-containing protein [Hamadaea sp.]|nr:DNRLRE domain-containing protein [Hamadaea sp.]
MTTEDTLVWALPTGRFRAEVAAGPVRVRRDGGWHEVNLTLTRRPDGSVRPVTHPNELALAGARAAGEHELATIGSGPDRLTLRWRGPLPEPVLVGLTATYPEVYPGVDLVVEVLRTGFESFIVIKNRAAVGFAGQAQAALVLRGPGSAASDGAGGLVFGRATGRTWSMPKPVMFDGAKDASTGLPRSVKDLKVRPDGTEVGFELDQAWLDDPARVFPIRIDPSGTGITASSDTWVNSSSPNSTYGGSSELEIGTQNSGSTKRLAYVNFGVGHLHGARITYANIKLWGTFVASNGGCTNGVWQLYGAATNASNSTSWNSRPYLIDGYRNQIDQNGADNVSVPFGGNLTPVSGGCTGQWLDSDATSLFQWAADRAVDGGTQTFSAVMRPYWDGTNNYYKRFKALESSTTPHAIVDYWFPPAVSSPSTNPATVPTAACTTGANRPFLGSATPELRVTVSQAEGLASDVTFEYWDLAGGAPVTAVAAGIGSGGVAKITTGTLVNGRSYGWHARPSGIGGVGGWSGECQFTVDIPPPPVAGCTGGLASGGDFNGDGVRDYVIADPQATVAGKADAGAVSIVSGATNAVTVLDQNLTEVPGSAEAGARFGYATTVFHANNDKCADLAISAPFLDAAGVVDSGAVYVLYGSPAGLGKSLASEIYEQGVGRTPGQKNVDDRFGWALAAGTAASTGLPFVIVGAPGEDVGAASDTGTVTYLSGPYRLEFTSSALGFVPETDERLGYALAATANHYAITRLGKFGFGGKVCVLTHAVTNGLPTMFNCVDQSYDNVTDVAEGGDGFGTSLSMAPYRAPGQPAGTDSLLAVGVPGEDLNGVPDTGMVQQFRLSGTNTVTELAATTLATSGMAAQNQAGALFGQRVLVTNLDPSVAASPSTMKIAAGAPGMDADQTTSDSGVVHVFAAGQATVAGHVTVIRGAGALPNLPHAREYLGGSLGATQNDLLVATPYGTDQAVYAITWSSLNSGQVTISRTWKPTVTTSGTPAPAAGAIAYWNLNEASGTTAADSTGNGRTLTLSASMGWTATGYQGAAFSQNTYGQGATTAGSVLDTTQSFTVEAWVKPTADDATVVSQDGQFATGFALIWDSELGKWVFFANDGNTCSPAAAKAVSTSTPNTGAWTRLTGVYDATAGQLRLYVNGQLEAATPYTITWNASQSFVVGRARWCGEPTSGFSGAIDEVRVWQRALTASEINPPAPVQISSGVAFGEQIG